MRVIQVMIHLEFECPNQFESSLHFDLLNS